MRFEKVLFLKKIDVFESIYGLVLADLIDITEEVQLMEGDTLTVDADYNDNFFIIYEGGINVYENGDIKAEVMAGEFIGEMVSGENQLNSNLIIAIEDSVLLKMRKDGFYDLLADNVRLAHEMIEYV